MDDLIDIRAELFAYKEPTVPRHGEYHIGFEEKLFARAGSDKRLAYLKQMTTSRYFVDVEKALNSSGRGKGGNVYIDHDKLIDAIEKAYDKYKNRKKTQARLLGKIQVFKGVKKKAEALLDAIELLNGRYEDYGHVQDIQLRLTRKIEKISFEHKLTQVSRSMNKTEGLTHEQVIFCRWLYIFLAVDYQNKLFAALIAAVASCLFKDNDNLTTEQVKSNLRGAKDKLNQQASYLRAEKYPVFPPPKPPRHRKPPQF